MAPIKDAVFGAGSNPIGALKSFVSIVVVINTSFVFTTFLLKWTSFCKTTFQLGFLKSLEKNTYVTWEGNIKGLAISGNLCGKFTIRNPTSSFT